MGARLQRLSRDLYNPGMSMLRAIVGSPREWATDLAIATGIGVFLGIIGPFGSFNGGPLEDRLVYWVIDLWIGFVMISVMVRALMIAATHLDLPIWFILAIGVAIGAVPLTIVLRLFSVYFWAGGHGTLAPFLDWYAQSLAIAEPISFGFYFLSTKRHAPTALPAAAAPTTRNGTGFLDRLPPHLGRNLLCLQMEDHYVRVHTELGSDLMLTPLKEAMAELEHVEGAQVHRSWWVARRAVAAAALKGRNHSLQLVNGLEVPVSRASVAKLRALGWLDTAP
jgi:hypothetical protein